MQSIKMPVQSPCSAFNFRLVSPPDPLCNQHFHWAVESPFTESPPKYFTLAQGILAPLTAGSQVQMSPVDEGRAHRCPAPSLRPCPSTVVFTTVCFTAKITVMARGGTGRPSGQRILHLPVGGGGHLKGPIGLKI
jgi:hypothetical protein